MLIRNCEAGVDCCRRGAPIFVELEAADTSLDLFPKRARLAVVAFARNAIVQREAVARLQHLFDQMGAGSACCSLGASAWSSAASEE